MYENFPFPLGKKLWKWLYNKNYWIKNNNIKSFHTQKNLYIKSNYRKVNPKPYLQP
jgi:hypothetical protein